jgi:hypothetical protein
VFLPKRDIFGSCCPSIQTQGWSRFGIFEGDYSKTQPAMKTPHLYLNVLLLGILCLFCLACKIPSEDPEKEQVLLFVGNSLTASNNLPKLVSDFARSKGRKIKTEMLALPNYALVDHWADGNLQELITSRKYAYVIVQQGPSSQAEGRALLLEAAVKIKELCKGHDAELAFFMVWPAYANYYNFEGVIKNYTEAANITNSILCPVGTRWKTYIDETRDLSYYDFDLFHPSPKGSQVAAEVIYQSLFER